MVTGTGTAFYVMEPSAAIQKKYIVNIEKISGWLGLDALGQFQISYQPRF